MNILDKSLQARILEKLNNSEINPNDLKSVVLAIGNKEGKYLIDLYPQFNGEIRFDQPAYKNKEINKKDMESLENDSSIAVFQIENGNELRLSNELIGDSKAELTGSSADDLDEKMKHYQKKHPNWKFGEMRKEKGLYRSSIEINDVSDLASKIEKGIIDNFKYSFDEVYELVVSVENNIISIDIGARYENNRYFVPRDDYEKEGAHVKEEELFKDIEVCVYDVIDDDGERGSFALEQLPDSTVEMEEGGMLIKYRAKIVDGETQKDSTEVKDIPLAIGEKGEGKTLSFVIEDENNEKHNGVIIVLPQGCKVKLDGAFLFQTAADINRTYAFLEREAKSSETLEEFKSRF